MKADIDPVDTARCPLCGGPNGCAMAQVVAGAAPVACWCRDADFAPELLARVPPEARRRACICAACVAAAAVDR
ncbi:cysteine-rich CWC family protein [Ottowia sp. GY511]|nr:cysteine-rich CWC family protein [Ottowia sp. GY511]